MRRKTDTETPRRATPRSQGFRAYLGAAIHKRRMQRGMTQLRLAEAAGVSLKYVGEIERGEANTTLDTIERLAGALEWDPAIALDGGEPITESIRVMLIGETEQVCCRLESMTTWLRALDPTSGRGDPATDARRSTLKASRPRARSRTR